MWETSSWITMLTWTKMTKIKECRITLAGSWGYVIGVPYYVISRSYLRRVLIVCQKRGICRWGKIHQFYLQFWKQRTKIEVHKKKELDTIKFKPLWGHFGVTYEGDQNCSKTHFMNILSFFGDLHIRHKNCPCQVWTSLCQVLFFLKPQN